MFEEERQIRIMNELTEHRSMSVADLARILNVSGLYNPAGSDQYGTERIDPPYPWRRDDCRGGS